MVSKQVKKSCFYGEHGLGQYVGLLLVTNNYWAKQKVKSCKLQVGPHI